MKLFFATVVVFAFSPFASAHAFKSIDLFQSFTTQACVPDCNMRGSDGSCQAYGADYCGHDAVCAPRCNNRASDGTCFSYDADHCGENTVCSQNCTDRGSDGTCFAYGADVCDEDGGRQSP